MNNNNTPALIRTLTIYAVCVPLAIWIGYLLAAPADQSTFGYAGIMALIMIAPILLRHHHFLLIAGWNFALTIFFLPGNPPVWLLLTALSLAISILHRTVNSRMRFISAPSLTWPMLFLFAVVIGTGELTGGFGLRSMGGDVGGSKHYITIIFGILAYFALTAQQIPPKRVGLYIAAFFLIGCSHAIGDLAPYVPSSLYFIFAFFPASGYDMDLSVGQVDYHARFAGLGFLGSNGVYFMLCYYGLRGILLGGKPWRWILFGFFLLVVPLGGFRSEIIGCGLVFTLQFFIEGLHRTKVMPVFIFAGVIVVTLLIPFSDKLPYTFQRSLAFLPLKIDMAARLDAEASSDWRLDIWRYTYPQVPQYLLLGRGYAISQGNMTIANSQNFKYLSPSDAVAISGAYHSGPLSVLMPFGAWGAIGLIWFWIAGVRALYSNFRYGDPAFRIVNSYLLASFIAGIFLFLIIFGAIENDVAAFAVLVGLSVSINGGIRRPGKVSVKVSDKPAVTPRPVPRFQPFYQG